jgi:protocatechuate 3,4-dioxygenase beta subunit
MNEHVFAMEEVNEGVCRLQTRRQNLRALGFLGAGLLLSGPARAACILAPSMTEGPYWVDEKLNRSDITTGTTRNSVLGAVPLQLKIKLFDDNGLLCSNIPAGNVMVDIWHCDAAGEYSDTSGAGQSSTIGQDFLRGYQISANDGTVIFKTVYPGWYQGRTTHIHFRARAYDATGKVTYNFTSQLFFDDTFTDQVYQQRAMYNMRGSRGTRNSNDSIYRGTTTPPLVTASALADGSVTGEVELGLNGLPTTSALQSFAVSLRTQGAATRPDLYADLVVATENIGQNAEIYVAAKLGSTWYFNNGTAWLKVTNPLATGFPAFYKGVLGQTHALKVLSGIDISGLGAFTLFVGYGSDNLDMLQNSRYRVLGNFN